MNSSVILTVKELIALFYLKCWSYKIILLTYYKKWFRTIFNLSVDDVKIPVNDRRSFEKFVSLGVMNDIPDATTVALFRERLRKANIIDELFEMFRDT